MTQDMHKLPVDFPTKKPIHIAKGAEWVLIIGAGGRSRTATGLRPPPPQDGVSTNSTTSAFFG